MTESHAGSRRWAVVTLLLGGAVSYPFLRKDTPPSELAHVASELGSQQTQTAGRLPDNRLVSGVLPSTTRSSSESAALESGWQDPGIFEAPAQVAMPEWVVPETGLDQVIAEGVGSQAVDRDVRRIGPLPTWTDTVPREHARSPSPQQPPSALADLSRTPWNEAVDPTQGQSARWGAELSRANTRDSTKIDWPDSRLARSWAEQADAHEVLSETESRSQVGALTSGTAPAAALPQRGRAVIRNPGPPRQPAYVFQPGYAPQE